MPSPREDENTHLAQMAKTPGFKVLQALAKAMEESAIRVASTDMGISADVRCIKLGEAQGVKKLLQQIVSRCENESKTPSWTETKE